MAPARTDGKLSDPTTIVSAESDAEAAANETGALRGKIRMLADRNPLCLAGQPASVRFVVAFGEEPLRERGRAEVAAAGWVGDPGQDGQRHRDP